MSCGVGRRRGSEPVFLWLWRRPAATAPIWSPAWDPPYAAAGVALKSKTKQNKKQQQQKKEKQRLDIIK